MNALTHQLHRERRALTEAWRQGFVAGVTLAALASSAILIALLTMGAGK